MWWWTVLVFYLLALIDNISAQDDVNGTETQSKLCCPCPPGWTGETWLAAPAPDAVGPASSSARASLDGLDRGLDDCPCRARDADSEGSASVFFPNTVRAFGNIVRPDPKEDSKPLLHPEVDLAASVLETLREATDEEYRDALERDAARAAASDVTSHADGVPEEARDVVTIIVSPRDMDTDDTTPEASHVQETRCIHSLLGNPSASVTNRAPVTRKGLEDILNLPLPSGLLHRQRDSNSAASNVRENVVKVNDNLNKILSGLRLRAQPSLLNLDPQMISEDINNILNGANLGNKASNSGLDRRVTANLNTAIEANDQSSAEVIEENDDVSTAEFENNNFDRQTDNQAELDSHTSPTNNLQTVFENGVKNTGFLKSLLQARNSGEKSRDSFPLKNLFKLRDVELVPLDILKNKPKPKTNVPIIKLDPLQITGAKELLPTEPVLFGKPSRISPVNEETVLGKLTKEKSTNIQTIPRRKLVSTDILDAVPSPSDDNCVRLKPEADKSAAVDMGQLEDSLLNSSTEIPDSDDEQIMDFIAKDDDTNINVFSSTEDIQLRDDEGSENDESRDTKGFELIDETLALEQGSESDIQVISQEDLEDVPSSSIDLSEINETEDRSNAVSEIHNPLRRLEEIRQSVVEKLNELEKSNRNALDSIKHNVEEISSRGERNQNTESTSNEDQISNLAPTFGSSLSADPIEEELKDENTSTESVNFQDLQNISDYILMASENDEDRAEGAGSHPIAESQEKDSESEEISESEIDNVLGMDESPKSNIDLKQSTGETDIINAEKTLCPSGLMRTPDQNKLQKNNMLDNEHTSNDLEPLASDPIINILRPTSLTSEPIINLLRPNSKSLVEHLNDFDMKLRQSIVQPTSLINVDDFNIFRTPSFNIPDISSLNANIPTLEEIRTRVSEILQGLARTAGDDDSSEIDSDDFASEVNPVVSTGASSLNMNSILPALKPLEDINLDIVQLRPIPSILGSSPQTLNFPGLNLNRYKAKLAIPKSLDLKPLNLASTLGNNGGLVGATLSIGPEKKDKSGKSRSKAKSNPDFAKSFRGASKNNPSLADITSSVHKNALHLLNIPKSFKGPYLQASNVIEDLAENIKTHTEDTLRSVHDSLKPTSNNLLRNANNLWSSGKSRLEQTFQTSIPIDSVVDNLRSQTENTIKHLHNTLHSPRIPDLSSVVQKNTHSVLKSSRGSVDAVVDNLKAQSENTFRNIQQTLDTSTLADISDSIHKTAQNILKSSPAINPTRDLLGSPLQAIPPIHEVAGNLRSQTENALKNIQQTLNDPSLSDISTSIQKSAQQVLKSPITNIRPELLRSTLQPSNSIETVVDNLNAQTQNTMRNIQHTLSSPTLADISATVHEHAQNLLNSPVTITGRDAFERVLQASTPVNLVPHAEHIAKDLQKTLKAALKSTPIKDLPPLPSPNDVLQVISNHHEDVNDKLYALHTDLTDRLETMHNEVTDPERLRSILSPPGNSNFELFAIPLPLGPRSAPITRKQTRPAMQAKQSSVVTQSKEPKKLTTTVSRPRPGKVKPGSMRAATGKESSSPKSFKIPAASSSIPTLGNRQPLPLTPKTSFKGLPDIKKPILPKFKPLTQSKVTVKFGSTTPRPTLAPKSNKIVPTTPKPRISNNKRFKPKGPVRQPTPWNGWGEARSAPKRLEPSTSPSRTAATVRPPLKSTSTKPITKPAKTLSKALFPVTPKLKSPAKPNIKMSPSTQSRASIPDSKLLSNLNKPKSPLLAKLSEALKAKQIDSKSSHIPRGKILENLPAASERFEKVVALEEPLKENVPYKCKMMCVKVDLNDES